MSTTAYAYLDAAATAPLRPEARAAMLAVLDDEPGNASSLHAVGHRAAQTLRLARGALALALHAREDEVIITSGGTEANNLAVIGLALAHPRGRHVVTSAIEHASVRQSCRFLERVHGFEISEAPVDAHGMVAPAAVAKLLRADTTLVTVGLANGEVGTVQAIHEIASLAHRHDALMHTDAVQAAATLPVSFGSGGQHDSNWPGKAVDAMSVASHKFGGPQGCGALLLRGGVAIEPIMHGGGQESGRRSGTENVAAAAGFGAACTAVAAQIGSAALALQSSRDELIARVLREVPGATLTGHPHERLPGHASFLLDGMSGESMLVALDVAGIAASSGSACAAGRDAPSAVLTAMGIAADRARTAIRFTLPAPISSALIDRVVAVMRAEQRTAASKRHDRTSE